MCISLVTNEIKRIFICSFGIFLFLRCLLMSFAHFLLGCFSWFIRSLQGSIHILWTYRIGYILHKMAHLKTHHSYLINYINVQARPSPEIVRESQFLQNSTGVRTATTYTHLGKQILWKHLLSSGLHLKSFLLLLSPASKFFEERVQRIYLKMISGSTSDGVGKWNREGRNINTLNINGWINTMSNWVSIPLRMTSEII